MAKGIRALLDTVMQALPQVGNLGLLFFLLFFIFAALGVEMFGRLGKHHTKLPTSHRVLKMYIQKKQRRKCFSTPCITLSPSSLCLLNFVHFINLPRMR